MSHLWESPSFAIRGIIQQANFQAQILDRLGPGDGTPEFPGLTQYLNTEFSEITKPVAIIMTPRNRMNPQPGVLMYQNQITQLSDKVRGIFGATRDYSGELTGGTLNGFPLIKDYTPKSDQYSQIWTSSGKALFQYDPVQIRCNGVQWAMVRLWIKDNPLYAYQHYWVARQNQVDAAPANPQQAANQKRQDQSADSTPAPSCLASMTATGSISVGAMSSSRLHSSPGKAAATTTAAGGNAAKSLAAISSASIAAEITKSPKSTTTGKYIYTETVPYGGPGTTLYGCTSTYTSSVGPFMATYCSGSRTPLTTIFPVKPSYI